MRNVGIFHREINGSRHEKAIMNKSIHYNTFCQMEIIFIITGLFQMETNQIREINQ